MAYSGPGLHKVPTAPINGSQFIFKANRSHDDIIYLFLFLVFFVWGNYIFMFRVSKKA